MRLLPKPGFASAIALIALFVSLGGTVYAAAKLDGKTIRKGSVPANRLKADSLTGAQVNESALAAVPSAASAVEATSALQAAMATSVERAEHAGTAEEATEALRAATATEAIHAKRAVNADEAIDAETLGGSPPSRYPLAAGCEAETIKAAAIVTPIPGNPPRVEANFNCSGGGPPTVTQVRVGEIIVTFPGLPAGFAVASPPSGLGDISVQPLGNGSYRVTGYRLGGFLGPGLDNFPFTLAIF